MYVFTRLLWLVGRLGPVNRFSHTRWMAVVTPTDRPTSVCNRCVIGVLCCRLVVEFPVGIRAFVIGLSQISFFFFSLFVIVSIRIDLFFPSYEIH